VPKYEHVGNILNKINLQEHGAERLATLLIEVSNAAGDTYLVLPVSVLIMERNSIFVHYSTLT